jgi:hypothetical protein
VAAGRRYAPADHRAVAALGVAPDEDGYSAQTAFQDIVKRHLSPGLRNLGFVGSSGTYSLPCRNCWALVGLQKWRYNTATEVAFTVNLSVVIKRTWRSSEPPSANITYQPPAVHSRIGHLLPGSIEDRWWRLTPVEDQERVAAEVLRCVEDFAVPWFRDQMATLRCDG